MILTYSLKKPIDKVYACLTDMQLFAAHHPVVYKIDNLQNDEYLFYEKIKFLGIPFSFTYKVILRNYHPNESVQMFSEVQKGTNLHLKFSLRSTTINETIVTEEILIESRSLIKFIFQIILKRVHKKLFKNIEQ